MIKTIKKSFLLLFSLFFGASVSRIVLDDFEYINNIIAFINTVSFLYVCYLILDDSNKKFVEILNNSDYIGEPLKDKKKYHYKNITDLFCIMLLIGSILYSLLYAIPIINDIVGFQALFLSIESNYISECIAKIFNKKM